MLFTSLGGAVLIITGLLSLAYNYEQNQTNPGNFVHSLVDGYNWFVPAILIFATFIGMVIQNKLVKGASDWKL